MCHELFVIYYGNPFFALTRGESQWFNLFHQWSIWNLKSIPIFNRPIIFLCVSWPLFSNLASSDQKSVHIFLTVTSHFLELDRPINDEVLNVWAANVFLLKLSSFSEELILSVNSLNWVLVIVFNHKYTITRNVWMTYSVKRYLSYVKW